MLLNRQKALLACIYYAGRIDKTVLMKSLFLLAKKSDNFKFYDFFPYFYGPYSWSLDQVDLKTLIKKNYITSRPYSIVDNNLIEGVISKLDRGIIDAIKEICHKFGHMAAWEIKKFVYSRYPYFAIQNEQHKSEYISYDPRVRSELQGNQIFTIGYEKKSLEQFINELITNNIKVLIDIRNNPKSMKFGFSGNKISHYLGFLQIKYIHIPELGIESKYRKKLQNEEDYIKLFQLYEKKMLPLASHKLKYLNEVAIKEKRIALMCFEKNPNFCHRSITAKHLNYQNQYGVLHI
jgi:uncharacterized protein (DUF488 family)